MTGIFQFLLIPIELLDWIVDHLIPLDGYLDDEVKAAVKEGRACDLRAHRGEQPFGPRAAARIVLGYAMAFSFVPYLALIVQGEVQREALHLPNRPSYARLACFGMLLSGVIYSFYGWYNLVFGLECDDARGMSGITPTPAVPGPEVDPTTDRSRLPRVPPGNPRSWGLSFPWFSTRVGKPAAVLLLAPAPPAIAAFGLPSLDGKTESAFRFVFGFYIFIAIAAAVTIGLASLLGVVKGRWARRASRDEDWRREGRSAYEALLVGELESTLAACEERLKRKFQSLLSCTAQGETRRLHFKIDAGDDPETLRIDCIETGDTILPEFWLEDALPYDWPDRTRAQDLDPDLIKHRRVTFWLAKTWMAAGGTVEPGRVHVVTSLGDGDDPYEVDLAELASRS